MTRGFGQRDSKFTNLRFEESRMRMRPLTQLSAARYRLAHP